MAIRTFVIMAHSPESGEEAINGFFSSHRVTTSRKEFVADGAESYWSVLVEFIPGVRAEQNGIVKGKVDYKEVLSPEAFTVYARLRDIRKACAEEKGIPPYAIFNNEHLAWLAQREKIDKAAFEAIPDAPKNRVEVWASVFLDRFAQDHEKSLGPL
jgi:superfamily II DNA helicase RecQ